MQVPRDGEPKLHFAILPPTACQLRGLRGRRDLATADA